MKQAAQPYFPGFEGLKKTEFGGSLLGKGHAREERPLSTKRPLHVVLRSEHAKGERSFLRRSKRVKDLVYRLGKKKGVRVYRFANAGNHLHLLILPKSKRAYQSYIRALSGILARLTLNAEKGSAKNQKFWDQRPWSRIVAWGKAFQHVADYFLQNTLEALGFIDYRPRKKRRLTRDPTSNARPSSVPAHAARLKN